MPDIRDTAPSEFQDGLARRVLGALRREYVLVGARRVKSWHAWLAIGIVAGIAFAAVIISSRGELAPTEAARRPSAARGQAKKFAPLPRNASPFRHRSATAGREQTFSGGVIRGIGRNALQVDAIVYDATISGWRAKNIAIPYISIRKMYSLELPARGFLKRREIKQSELAPGMRVGIMRIGNRVDINVLPPVPIARP